MQAKLLRLKGVVEDKQQQQAETQARLKIAKEDLKKLGFTTVKKAQKHLDGLAKEIETEDSTFQENLATFQEKWDLQDD